MWPWRGERGSVEVMEASTIKAKPCNALWHKAHIRAEKRNGKNVHLIKKPCFPSNINDPMKGFTHNRRYSEFIRLLRIVINNFSGLPQATPLSLWIHGFTGRLSTSLTDTCTPSETLPMHVHALCLCSFDLFFTFPFDFLWVTSSGGNTLQLYLYFDLKHCLMRAENKSRNLVQCFASLVNSCALTLLCYPIVKSCYVTVLI